MKYLSGSKHLDKAVAMAFAIWRSNGHDVNKAAQEVVYNGRFSHYPHGKVRAHLKKCIANSEAKP